MNFADGPAKIDQHLQQFAAQGVSEAHAITNRHPQMI
jgi:hypothetical protein